MTPEATVENVAPAKLLKRIVSCGQFECAGNRASESERIAPNTQVFEREFVLKPWCAVKTARRGCATPPL
jgi:hypothetical protein